MANLEMPTLGVTALDSALPRGEARSRPQHPVTVTRRVSELIRMARFAVVGAAGTVVNLSVMAALLAAGGHYIVAAIVAAEVSIIGNFLLQERYVFQDRKTAASTRRRFVQAVGFNNLEALARLPFLALLVELLRTPAVLAQALTLAAAFLLRFTFMSRVVYRVPMQTGRQL